MIKFFRNIRKKLLVEGKTTKYLKYAIGEIVLVVIGILIALQINNWNEYRKARILEKEFLNEILLNLDKDIENLKIKIDENNTFKRANSEVLKHLTNKTSLTDSLKHHYSYLMGYGNFQPIKVGYEGLKTQGIALVKNKSLRNAISELYEFKYFYIVEDIRSALQPAQQIRLKQLIEKITTKKPYESAQPVDVIALQNDSTFKELLQLTIFARTWSNWRYESGIKDIKNVQDQIKKEMVDD